MPTTFSTALPAIATITRPANVGEMCTASMAGVSAATNHSDTNAALTPAAAVAKDGQEPEKLVRHATAQAANVEQWPLALAIGLLAACAVACRTSFSGSCPSLATAAGRDK